MSLIVFNIYSLLCVPDDIKCSNVISYCFFLVLKFGLYFCSSRVAFLEPKSDHI